MSKFNTTLKSKPDTTNLAGGSAYTKSPKLQIASILLTSFCKDTRYESESDFITRLREQYSKLSSDDKIFLAKAAIYARNEFGMRSITHVAANIILDDLKNNTLPWASKFFNRVVARPDDMSEIISCYWQDGKKSLPNSLMNGFASAFNRFDDYQISKYMMKDKAVSLVDIVNLCHPKPSERNAKALKDLVNNTLKPAETFNNALAKAGRTAETQEQKEKNKAEVWKAFVEKGNKVEMFALLRNLRNIMKDADEDTKKEALKLLVDKNRIKKSKIMPFRFLTAYNEFEDNAEVREALRDALDLSVSNVPVFDGKTLVALDMSGSMYDSWYQIQFVPTQPFTIGSVFAAALAKNSNTDLCLFSSDAYFKTDFGKKDTVLSIAKYLHNEATGGGTSFRSVFDLISMHKRKYDRIILISDEQSWIGTTRTAYNMYRAKFSPECKFFMFDLRGHGTLQIPEANCYSLAGMSDKTFDLMQKLDADPKALVHTIESIDL